MSSAPWRSTYVIAPGAYFFTHCRGTLSPKELVHSKGPKPLPYRIAAVRAVAAACTGDIIDWDKATAVFKCLDNSSYAGGVSGHYKDFLKRNWEHFCKTGRVDDADRSGRPAKLPEQEAKRASELIKAGKWVWVLPKKNGIKRQVYFRTIPQAIKEVPELQKLVEKYKLTADALRHRMLKVDPDLMRHTLTMKYDHDAASMRARQQYCKEMLAAISSGPNQRQAFLESLVFCDEATVILSTTEDKKIHAWVSKEHFNKCTVLHMPHVKGYKDCKIHFFIAVSAHPAFQGTNGLVYWEFTTGTTALKRYHNTRDQEDGEAFYYQVGLSPLSNMYCQKRRTAVGSTTVLPHTFLVFACIRSNHNWW